MFKKLKERIADCESCLNTQNRRLTEYRARINDISYDLFKLQRNIKEYGHRKVDTAKTNADILLDCLCDVKEKSEDAPAHIWINGVKTDRSIFKDTNDIFSVYISLRKSFGSNNLRILEYTVDKDNVYFEIEPVTGDEYD